MKDPVWRHVPEIPALRVRDEESLEWSGQSVALAKYELQVQHVNLAQKIGGEQKSKAPSLNP